MTRETKSDMAFTGCYQEHAAWFHTETQSDGSRVEQLRYSVGGVEGMSMMGSFRNLRVTSLDTTESSCPEIMTRPERKPAVGVEQHRNKHLAGENSAGRKYRKSKYEDLDRLACLKYEDLGRSAFCAKKNIDQVGRGHLDTVLLRIRWK